MPFGIELYSEVYSSPVQVASLPEDRQDEVTDHELRGRDDAESLIGDLEDVAAEPEPRPQPSGGGGGGGESGQQPGRGDQQQPRQ